MNNKHKTLIAVSVSVIVTALLTFTASSWYFGAIDTPKLSAALGILDKYYYQKPDLEKLDEAATAGAVSALGDPYTEYMNKDEWESFSQQLEAEYCGIGVVVTKEKLEDYLLVVSSFENSPAKEAGLDTGDKITKVEGTSTAGRSVDDIVAGIKGKEGTEVTITVQKSGESKESDVKLTRKMIDIETVYSELLDGGFGYIQLTSFNDGCGEKFIQHMNDLTDSGAKSLIIDLRSNGGGLTKEAETIANALLPKGSVVYSTKNKAGKTDVIKTKSEGNTTIPIAVLVDGNTASASEILSAAIKENGRGVLVGAKTFGKGLVQTVFNFTDGSALKVTIEQYFTPDGNDINKLGIQPDYPVELKTSADEQLDYAKTVLTGKDN